MELNPTQCISPVPLWHVIPVRKGIDKRCEIPFLYSSCTLYNGLPAATPFMLDCLWSLFCYCISTIQKLLFSASKRERSITLTTSFVIWRERCTRIFRDEEKTMQQLLQEVILLWQKTTTATTAVQINIARE